MTTSRTELIQAIAQASIRGSVGLFVGSGIPKALTRGKAPDWKCLLENCASSLDLGNPYQTPELLIGKSFPAIASDLCRKLASTFASYRKYEGRAFSDLEKIAIQDFKLEICRQTNFEPEPSIEQSYKLSMEAINPAWVVTTNYDFLIENILDTPETLLPSQILGQRLGVTPVYHMHGHRHDPESIVITQEDYGKIYESSEYRHTKLSFLFAESLTLMLGYSLGDQNVQTALNLSSRLGPGTSELRWPSQGLVVIFNRTEAPSQNLKWGPYGEVIIDCREVLELLEEIKAEIGFIKDKESISASSLISKIQSPSFCEDFISSSAFRSKLLDDMESIPGVLSLNRVVEAIKSCFVELSNRAHSPDGWKFYATWLEFILDIFERWNPLMIPGPLFEYLAGQLNVVAAYVYPAPEFRGGYSIYASIIWQERKKSIVDRPYLMRSLYNFARRESNSYLIKLLDPVIT